MSSNNVEWVVEVSSNIDQFLNEASEKSHVSKSELLMRAIGLLKIAFVEEAKGHHMAIIDNDRRFIDCIEGIV